MASKVVGPKVGVHSTELGGDWRWRYLADFVQTESDMPRIREDFLECAVYLYRSQHEAKEGINAGGTGFILGVDAPEIGPRMYFAYVVTNRHVQSKAKFVRVNTKSGSFAVIQPIKWFTAENDDLALGILLLQEIDVHLRHISLEMVLSEEKAKEINLGIGDQVFLVGRFINHEGKQRNMPTVRFGHIAQMPGEPVETLIDGQPHQQISILADVKSIGGYSGSPVFLHEYSMFGRGEKTPGVSKHYFIGVDWGHINDWAPVCGFNQEPIAANHQVKVNTGMACIVPSWKLLDLVMRPDVKKTRDASIELSKAAKANKAASADIAEPSSADNPNHKEDFRALLGAAARKPK